MPSLFISYRRGDSPDTVKLIYERLMKQLPRWEIFYDHESIPLGEQFREVLRAKVAAATVVLVVIGPRWPTLLRERKTAAVDHVREEVRLALETARSVVPVLVGCAVMPAAAELSEFPDLQPMLERNGRPVRPDPDFDGDLEPIIDHIKQFDSAVVVGATLADKYTLTAEIGHGGMGVVYRAEQRQPVKRTVAVKLIKPGMDSREVLARFDAERQALAVMDHPNIARVHDAGMTANGRPFFVMELVKGVPITQYCDDKKLTPQERINLFIPVCNAVQHAHQKGIIHRDLKPNNMLVEVVDGKPVVKVIDFGLAKALGQKLTDKTLYTDLNMRVGTLEYSAPEQAAGRSFDVDTRSDIYSLGVLLYELLTGAPPFTHEELLKIGEEEMRRVIREKEPTKPSKKLSSSGELPAIAANRQLEPKKLTRLVRGDLDWIVMKCLEKENARRYETANQLGQELQRFLADEPVQAGPPSATYRLRKFVRRHKARLLPIVAMLLAMVLVVTIAFWQISAARDEALKLAGAKTLLAQQNEQLATQERIARQSADQAKQESERERINAEAEARKATRVADLLIGTFQASDPLGLHGLTPYIPKAAGETLTAKEILNRGTERVQLLDKEPDVQVRLLTILGDIYVTLGEFDRAQELLQKALKRSEKEAPQESEPSQRAAILYSLGWLAHQQGDYPRARRLYEETLASREKMALPTDPLVSGSMFRLAWLLAEMRDYTESERLFRKVIDLRKRQLGPDHREVGIASLGLAALYLEQQRDAEALGIVTQTLPKLLKQVGSKGLVAAAGEYMRGLMLGRLPFSDLSVARAHLEKSLRLIRQSGLGKQHVYEGMVLLPLAQTLALLRETREAKRTFEECLAIARLRVGLGHPRAAVLIGAYASFLDDQGQPSDADRLFEELLAAHRERFGPGHSLVADALVAHGELLCFRKDYVRSEQKLREALNIYRQPSSSRQGHYGICLGRLGDVCLRLGRPAEAEPLLEEALGCFRKSYGQRHASVGTTLVILAEARMSQRKYAGTDQLLKEAQKILPRSHADADYLIILWYRYHRETRQPAKAVALALEQRRLRGDDPEALFDIAEELCRCRPLLPAGGNGPAPNEQSQCAREACLTYQQAIDLYRKKGIAHYPRYRVCLNQLAIQLGADQAAEAERLYREALPLNRKAFGEKHREIAVVLGNLGLALTQQKKYCEAEEVLRQALSMHHKVANGQPDYVLPKLVSLYQQTGRPAEAIEAALERRPYCRNNPAGLYAIAQDIARSIPLVGRPKAGPEDDQLRECYTYEALTVLRQAIDAGFANLAALRTDPALQPLRARTELQELIQQVETKRAP